MSEVERQRKLARELAQVVQSYGDLRESAIGSMLFAAWLNALSIQSEDEAIRVFAAYLNDAQRSGAVPRSG